MNLCTLCTYCIFNQNISLIPFVCEEFQSNQPVPYNLVFILCTAHGPKKKLFAFQKNKRLATVCKVYEILSHQQYIAYFFLKFFHFQKCVCIWKSGKETAECINRGLDRIPDMLEPTLQVIGQDTRHVRAYITGDIGQDTRHVRAYITGDRKGYQACQNLNNR